MQLLKRCAEWDEQLFEWMFSPRFALKLPAARWVTHSADGPWYVLIPFVLLHVHVQIAQQAAAWLMLGFVFERVLYYGLKQTIRRARPYNKLPGISYVLAPPDEFSFPSGHTSGAFLVATVLGGLLPSLYIPLLVWGTAVGLSRVVLGVHFPSDVVVGAAIGSSSALFTGFILQGILS